MKKIVIFILMIAIVVSLQAQSVRDFNGYDWMGMTSMEKQSFCLGYMLGTDNYRLLVEEVPNYESEELQQFSYDIYNWLTFPGTTSDMVKLIDRFYTEHSEVLDFPVQEVILFIYEKDWWTERE
jgi:hypothetical protein